MRNKIICYIAELVCAGKEHSDWFPDRLRYNVRLKGAKCFNFDRSNRHQSEFYFLTLFLALFEHHQVSRGIESNKRALELKSLPRRS